MQFYQWNGSHGVRFQSLAICNSMKKEGNTSCVRKQIIVRRTPCEGGVAYVEMTSHFIPTQYSVLLSLSIQIVPQLQSDIHCVKSFTCDWSHHALLFHFPSRWHWDVRLALWCQTRATYSAREPDKTSTDIPASSEWTWLRPKVTNKMLAPGQVCTFWTLLLGSKLFRCRPAVECSSGGCSDGNPI